MTQVTPIRPQRLLGLDEIKPRLRCNYVVKGWFDRDAVSVLFGESNTGKTFLALDLALHVASGKSWRGARVRRSGVLYIAAEGAGGLANRLAAIKEDIPDHAQAAQGRFHLLAEAVDLFDGSCGLGVREITNELTALSERPGLIVIDTLSRAMGTGDENSAADMSRFLRNVDTLRKATGAHVMLVHHTGKDGAKGARGSSALRAAVDTEIALSRSNGVTTARTSKQRDMIGGATFSYSLRPVHLGNDDDGDPVASAVVEPVEDYVGQGALNAPDAPLSDRQKVALDALSDAENERTQAPDFEGKRTHEAGAPIWVPISLWRTHCDKLELSTSPKANVRRSALSKVKKSLESKGLIEVDGDMVRGVVS